MPKPLAIITLIVSCCLLSTVATYLYATSLQFDLSSDQLTIPSLFWDVTHRGWHQLATWQLSRAPYIFPDILLFFGVGSIVAGTFDQIFVACLLTFLAWISIAGLTVARATGRPWVQAAAVLLLLEGLITWLLAGTIYEVMLSYRFGMANHFSSLIAAYALFNLIDRPATDASRAYAGRRLAASLLLLPLTLSDQSIVPYYVGPIGLVILDAGLRKVIPLRRMILLGFEQLAPAAFMVLLGRRLFERLIALQPVPIFDIAALPAAFVHMLMVLPHDDPVILIGFWAPLLASTAYALIISGRRQPRSPLMLRRRATTLFCLGSTALTLLLSGELYQNMGNMLYLTPALENPLVIGALVLVPALGVVLRWILPAFAAAILGVYLSIVIRAHDIRQPLLVASENAHRAYAACVRDHGLTAGLAAYGVARRVMVLMDYRVPIAQLAVSQPTLFHWGNNLDWFSQAISDPRTNRFPAYNFVILNDLAAADVIATFGPWSKTFICNELTIAKYDRPGALSNVVEDQLSDIDRRTQPTPDHPVIIPLDAFRTNVGVYSQHGWEAAPGTPAGHLTFGPFATLDSGHYDFVITVSADGLDDQSYIDVTAKLGHDLIAKQPIPAHQPPGRPFDVTLHGTIAQKVTDLEIRSWYGGKGTLRIDRVRIIADPAPSG